MKTRLAAVALLLTLPLTSCDDGHASSSVPMVRSASASPAVRLAVREARTWPIDPDRTSEPVLGPTYVVWATGSATAGPRRVRVAGLDGGAVRTIYRTGYAGGRIYATQPVGSRVLVVDGAAGPSAIPDPFVRWRLVSVDLRSGRSRVLARSAPGHPSWPAHLVVDGRRVAWTVSAVPDDPSRGWIVTTWRPGRRPEVAARLREGSLVGRTSQGMVVRVHDDLELRAPSGAIPITTDGLVVGVDLAGDRLAWTERSGEPGASDDPASLHVVDLREPTTPWLLRDHAVGWAIGVGRGFVLWSTTADGLRVLPILGGRTVDLVGRSAPPQYVPDVRRDRVAYVRRTPGGAELVVARVQPGSG